VIFAKGHGTENDFVLLPDLDAELTLTAARVTAVCDRRRGLGADGVLRITTASAAVAAGVLERLPDGVGASDWYMDYRNADGSIAQMCGNGVRVFARYLVDQGLAESGRFGVATRGGIKTVHVPADGGDITVDMTYTTRKFFEANPKLCAAFIAAMNEANALIARDSRKASEIYLAISKQKSTPDEIIRILADPNSKFSTVPNGTMKYAEFMSRVGTIKAKPATWKDLFFAPIYGAAGS